MLDVSVVILRWCGRCLRMSVARYRVWLANLQHLFLELLYFVRTSIEVLFVYRFRNNNSRLKCGPLLSDRYGLSEQIIILRLIMARNLHLTINKIEYNFVKRSWWWNFSEFCYWWSCKFFLREIKFSILFVLWFYGTKVFMDRLQLKIRENWQ